MRIRNSVNMAVSIVKQYCTSLHTHTDMPSVILQPFPLLRLVREFPKIKSSLRLTILC